MDIPTYQDQLELVRLKHARVSTDGIFDTFKYSKHVMYDYKWNDLKHMHINECRGHVYCNQTGELVQLPASKSFNYLELDTWKDVSLGQEVIAFKKYNGYMLACTTYNGELVVSTTGSTKSEYVIYAKNYIKEHWDEYKDLIDSDHTTLFEVIADWDKHIVDDPVGIFVLGKRNKETGYWYPLGKGMKSTLGEMLELVRTEKHEGWMVYLVLNGNEITSNDFCKIKTDYYVGKKKLMRMKKVDTIWTHTRSVENQLPEQWKFAVETIKDFYTAEEWRSKTDQQRGVFLENMYEQSN
jgi:hypothetical protein